MITEILDWVIGISLLVSVLLGWHRGLVLTAARLGAVVVTYIGARSLAVLAQGFLGQQWILPVLQRQLEGNQLGGLLETALEEAAEGIAYSIVFFVAFAVLEFILLRLVNGLKVIDSIPVIGRLNKLGGAVVGFLWVFLVFVLAGNVFFTYVPGEIRHQMGFTNEAVKESVLLQVFVPRGDRE